MYFLLRYISNDVELPIVVENDKIIAMFMAQNASIGVCQVLRLNLQIHLLSFPSNYDQGFGLEGGLGPSRDTGVPHNLIWYLKTGSRTDPRYSLQPTSRKNYVIFPKEEFRTDLGETLPPKVKNLPQVWEGLAG
jgi:hypothetical protein